MSSAPDPSGRLIRHERAIVACGVALLAALAWLFLLRGAGMPGTAHMPAMASPPFAALLLMWWVMMVAMMLPSAAPAILLYDRVRETRSSESGIAQSWIFVAGYALLWLLFSIAAAAAQRLVIGSAIIEAKHMMAAVLIAAGAYQLSPLKSACLSLCRSPAQFLSRHWRPGVTGAIRLGMLHGAYCVGCCWALMALLFVGGVMNIGWIVLLTLIVAAEKLAPAGAWIGRAAGIALIAWGAALLLA